LTGEKGGEGSERAQRKRASGAEKPGEEEQGNPRGERSQREGKNLKGTSMKREHLMSFFATAGARIDARFQKKKKKRTRSPKRERHRKKKSLRKGKLGDNHFKPGVLRTRERGRKKAELCLYWKKASGVNLHGY